MRRRLRHALVLAVLAMPAAAAAPDDYGYHFDLRVDPDAGPHRLTLTPAVYARIQDRGLGDLELFNAAGESLPFGPVAEPAAATPAVTRRALPWFLLPARAEAVRGDGSLRLAIERDADGRLRRMQAAVDAAAPPRAGEHLLLDLDGIDQRIEALELAWARGNDVSARFRVLGGDDLLQWRPLRDDVALVDLERGGQRLLRQRIELPPLQVRYLLLWRSDAGAPLAIEAVTATLRSGADHTAGLVWTELQAQADPQQPGRFTYRAPGPLPVQQLAVLPAAGNSVATVEVASRDAGDDRWRPRARYTAFRLGEGDAAVSSDPQPGGPTRDREWQVTSTPALAPAPLLRLGYRPDQFALLLRGDGPYRLAVGSARARRPAHPLAGLLDTLRQRDGAAPTLAEAGIGAEREQAGEGALRAPLPWRQWALWAALVAGALLVAGMVLRLARSG